MQEFKKTQSNIPKQNSLEWWVNGLKFLYQDNNIAHAETDICSVLSFSSVKGWFSSMTQKHYYATDIRLFKNNYFVTLSLQVRKKKTKTLLNSDIG